MRNIDSSIWRDEWFGTLEIQTRLYWLGILNRVADDQGRFLYNPRLILADLFPFDDQIEGSHIKAWTDLFLQSGKLLEYTKDDKQLMQVVKWWKYQSRSAWMAASKYPAPDGWVDRSRFHGPENKIITDNWDHPGGFNGNLSNKLPSTLPSQLPSNLPRPQSKARVKGDVKDKDEKEKEVKSQSVLSRELLIMSAVPEKYIQRLTDPSQPLTITRDDFLAELARNYARIGSGRGQVKNPPAITAMNILKGELPPPTWYKPENLKAFLPKGVLQHARLDLLQEDQKDCDPVFVSGYTKSWIPKIRTVPEPIRDAWGRMLACLDQEAGKEKGPNRANFDTWISDTTPVHFSDGKLFVGSRNALALDWLNDHGFPELAQLRLGDLYPDPVEIVLTVTPEAP